MKLITDILFFSMKIVTVYWSQIDISILLEINYFYLKLSNFNKFFILKLMYFNYYDSFVVFKTI